ncbi:MAG: AraC family transcriptional regulator [Cytophagaceae bacterium]|nr:MAG: AraC family transcriptional regulator [Cytophagaceae bacterium]
MYIQSVIDTHEQSVGEFTALKAQGGGNTIINSVSKLCSWPMHADRFSLKFAFNGVEHYWVNKNKIPVRGNQFLVVNANQSHASSIHSSDWVNSFTIYVDPLFFNQVVAAYTTPDQVLLDNPSHKNDQSVWFFEQVYQAQASFSEAVMAFKTRLEGSSLTQAEQEEYLHHLLALLLNTYQSKLTRNLRSLSCVKMATRLELYRRLHLAKEYIDDQAATMIQLDDIAQTAMLSKNHLLRHFKALFQCSPHQYLVRRRLERARDNLLVTARPVHEIALEQGFDDHSAFGRRFKSAFMLTPSAYRQQFANK